MPLVSLSTARGFARWEKSILNHSRCHTITYPLHVRERPVSIPTRPAKTPGPTLRRNARGMNGAIALRAHRVSVRHARRIHFSPKGSNDAAPVARPRRMCFAFGTQPISEPPNTNSGSFTAPKSCLALLSDRGDCRKFHTSS